MKESRARQKEKRDRHRFEKWMKKEEGRKEGKEKLLKENKEEENNERKKKEKETEIKWRRKLIVRKSKTKE